MYQVYRTGDEWLTICHLSGERLIQMRGEWTNHLRTSQKVSLLVDKQSSIQEKENGPKRRAMVKFRKAAVKWGEDKVSHLKAFNFKSHSVSAYTVYTGWSHSIRVYIKKKAHKVHVKCLKPELFQMGNRGEKESVQLFKGLFSEKILI